MCAGPQARTNLRLAAKEGHWIQKTEEKQGENAFFMDNDRQLNHAVGMIQHDPQKRVAEIKRALFELGPLHPGSISEQYNICGTPGCRCKDPANPQKHGPYYQLSYGWRGKSSSLFVRPDQVRAMREKVANYKRLQELVKEWVDLAMDMERLERVAQKRRRD